MVKTDNNTIMNKMHQLENKMRVIEWDKKVSGTLSKDYIYAELKEEFDQLKKQLGS